MAYGGDVQTSVGGVVVEEMMQLVGYNTPILLGCNNIVIQLRQ